jgi:acetyltransferase-like isoleucine patch superfamily enzyme
MKNIYILLKILLAKTFWKQTTSLLKSYLSSNVMSIQKLKHLGNNSHIAPSVRFAYPEHISIGDYSDIGSQTHIYAGMKSKITIGNNTLIGPFVFMTSDSFSKSKFELTEPHSGHQADIEIGDNVRIGAHSILLPGVHIGNNIAIGAGSVVTKDIPSGKIVAGNPAKIIKDL